MDYKKKYEDAIERCKKEFNFNNLAYSHEEIRERLEHVFPELKESEDEKIRNGIIQYLEQSQFGEEHYQIDDDIVRNYIAWLEKQGEQKPAWSEEDEKRVESLHGWLDTLVLYIHYDTTVPLDLRRDRIQEVERLKTWLKSLKDRYTWKPSDEQMKVLNEVINYAAGHQSMHWNDYVYNILKQFKSQLKKMKGE